MHALQSELLNILNQPNPHEDELRQRVLEVIFAQTRPHKMTYEDFLNSIHEDTLAEWVNGEVIMTSPASRKHQEISGLLHHIVGTFVEAGNFGVVLLPPFQMKLDYSVREPDLIFIAKQHLGRLKETYLEGPADLVVEITSPESLSRDRGDKFAEYEQAGIPEYWLIDPIRERAEFYQFDDQNRYALVLPDSSGAYHSKAIPGFWLRVDWFWRIPPILDALRELKVI